MFRRRGLLQSKASLIPPGNVWQYPIDFTNAAWALTSTSLVGGYIAPDGSATAYKVMEDGANAFHDLYDAVGATVLSSTYRVQFYIKSLGLSRYLGLSGAGLTGATECPVFNPDTGVVDMPATSVLNKGASMSLTSNGWWRCKALITAGNTNAFIFSLTNSSTANAMAAYQGDGAAAVLIWGAHHQLA
jgi:hypothetical protein